MREKMLKERITIREEDELSAHWRDLNDENRNVRALLNFAFQFSM